MATGRSDLAQPPRVPGRQRAQALVELVVASSVLLVLVFIVFEGVWWAYAQNVVTVAVQDGAERASRLNGDLAHGQERAQELLKSGLGPSATLVKLSGGQDAQSVRLAAVGQWPVGNIAGVPISLPLHAEARMLRERWQP